MKEEKENIELENGVHPDDAKFLENIANVFLILLCLGIIVLIALIYNLTKST